MQGTARVVVGSFVALLLLSCGRPQGQTTAGIPSEPAPPKRATLAVASDFNALSTRLVRSGTGTRPGAAELERLVNGGLAQEDSGGFLQPELAEAVPTVENGLWRVFSDGGMETTWRIRQGAAWQDGTPFTAEDMLFTARVSQDREVPNFRNPFLEMVEGLTASDPRTLVVRWKQPFIEADWLFSLGIQLPLPKHLLEAEYLENKRGFDALPYWSEGFVGTGPYRVREWLLGSFLVLDANDGYVLGRPRIDTIEVRFFGDPTVLHAALLANAIDLPLGTRGTSLDQAVELQKQWNGVIEFLPGAPLGLWPQLLTPNPAIVADARFRRALLQATNRQEMADTLVGGRVGVAHSFILPDDPEHSDLQASIVRYEYDPRSAAQAVEALGYTRAADGIFRDSVGERLTVEIRSSQLDILNKSKLAVADYWQRIGVAVTPLTESETQRANPENRATFPGFETRRGTSGTSDFKYLRSSEARIRERGFIGQNVSNYMNSDFDALIDRFFVTIARPERMEVGRQIVHHLTDQVIPLLTYYDVGTRIVGGRLQNVAMKGNAVWGAQTWDVK